MRTALQIDGTKFIFITQQYEVGLYVAIYQANEQWKTVGIPDQHMNDKSEQKYHQELRKEATKKGHYIEAHSSPLNTTQHGSKKATCKEKPGEESTGKEDSHSETQG